MGVNQYGGGILIADPLTQLRYSYRALSLYLEHEYDVEAVIKARDRREPGRREKEAAELALELHTMRYFRRVAKKLRDLLKRHNPDSKAIAPPIDYEQLLSDDDWERALVIALTEASQGGVKLFSQLVTIGINYTAVNTQAAEWARQYVGELVQGIEETSRKGIREAISAFVETPGMTIGDVINRLPFTPARAQNIAVTEITRAYAEGNQRAAEQLKREYPDVRVIKTWYTNNDDRVCPICAPLDLREVEYNQAFERGITNPPAHPQCRCWTQTSTALAEL